MRNRTQLVLGMVLILLGAWFIAQRQIPAFNELTRIYMGWPLNLVAIGAVIFLLGLLLGAPGMSVPAAIVAGIGGIIYYQGVTENYTSWSYMWTLIPGFVGVGEIVSGLLSRSNLKAGNGVNLVTVSLIMFVVFAAIFGRLTILGVYGPAILLILAGILVLIRGFWKKF